MPEAVVVGAGHNGLVAANLLVDAGMDVLVLEAAGEVGGATRSGALTVPGFRHDLFSAFYPLAAVSPVMRSLELESYGLAWRRAPLALAHAGKFGAVAVHPDTEVTAGRLDDEQSGDGEAWRQMVGRFASLEPDLLGAVFSPFPPLRHGAEMVRKLKPIGALRLARDMLLPARRMGEEWFEGTGARLLLAGCAMHADISIDSAGSGAFGWLLANLAQRVGFPVPAGGAGEIAASLVSRLTRRGGQVQLGREVEAILVSRGRAVGVRTKEGDEIQARRAVLAAVSAPRLYLDLVDAGHLPSSVLEDVSRFQWDAATLKVDWALSQPCPFDSVVLREAGTVHIADDLDELSQYCADLAMGRLPARPFLILGQLAKADPARAPEGADTAWAYTHLPRRLGSDAAGEFDVGGDEWVAGFVERIEKRIEERAPGFRDRVVGRHVFTPAGLQAADSHLSAGAINGGTAQLHQQLVFRPIPGWARAETPVAGLYLASSSAHPGGGVHGGPGANAARAVLGGMPRLRAGLLGRGGRRAVTSALRGGRVEER